MKIGTSLGISPREPIMHAVEVVQNAEALGFDAAYITDVQLSMKDCFAAMTLCAVNTTKIKIGTGVTNPVTRHPSTLACQFSGLKELSNDRAVLGLGTGWTGVYPIGLKPATIKYLEESIVNIKALCDGKEVEGGENGEPYSMTIANGRFPIFVAANQPRILKMCGRVADGVILMGGASEEFTKWQIDLVREGAEEVGRDFNEIELHLWAAIGINDDIKQSRDDVSHWAASQAETFYKWKHLPDFLHKFKDDFERAGAAYDRSHHLSSNAAHKSVVSDEFIDFVAFTGNGDQCLERIKSLGKLGLHGVTLAFRAGAGGRLARMQEISEKIIKRL
jgi:5,10-methylenetetrahydromethanopterin reductase